MARAVFAFVAWISVLLDSRGFGALIWEFPIIKGTFLGPYTKGHNTLGFVLGSPSDWKLPCHASFHA